MAQIFWIASWCAARLLGADRLQDVAQVNELLTALERRVTLLGALRMALGERDVLVRIGRALNPRKLAPIMARMNPVKAKDLTASLAVDQVEPTIQMTPAATTGELPQIVGQ